MSALPCRHALIDGLLHSGRPVAVKAASGASAADPGAREALMREARVLSAVSHPNLVACYGGCLQGDKLFIVEVGSGVAGKTKRQRLKVEVDRRARR